MINDCGLVVGDIIHVNPGDIVSIDGLVIKSYGLVCDETNSDKFPTGVQKSEDSPFVISGCKVLSGTGSVLVVAVGVNTLSQRIIKTNEDITEIESGLQYQLIMLAEKVGLCGILASVSIFVIFFIHLVYNIVSGVEINLLSTIIYMLTQSALTIFLTVPEILPAYLSLSLSLIDFKSKNLNLKSLSAQENISQARNIITHKTAILTLNLMKVVKLCINGNIEAVSKKQKVADSVLMNLSMNICYNSTTVLAVADDIGKAKEKYVGSPIEAATLKLIGDWGYSCTQLKENLNIIAQLPFSRETRIMATIVHVNENHILFVKGAPEVVLKYCSYHLDESGIVQDLSKHQKTEVFEKRVEEFGNSGLKSLGFAYKILDQGEYHSLSIDTLPKDLVFQAVLAIRDPVRPGPSPIKDLQDEGITIRLVTGDHRSTAIFIAKKSEILPLDYSTEKYPDAVLTGEEFITRLTGDAGANSQLPSLENKLKNMKTSELECIVRPIRVLARASPRDKYLLTCALNILRETVMVAGSRISDEAAMRIADVAVGLNEFGCDCIKKDSDFLLLNDGFKEIHSAIAAGKALKIRTRRYFQFLMAAIGAYCCITVVSAIWKDFSFSLVQSFWIYFILSYAAAILFANENIENTQAFKNKDSEDRLIDTKTVKCILVQGIYQSLCGVYIIIGMEYFSIFTSEITENKHQGTMLFHSFCILQFFSIINAFTVKQLQELLKNRMTAAIIILVFTTQYSAFSIFSEFFNCVPLTLQQTVSCIIPGIISMFLNSLSKIVSNNFAYRFTSEPIYFSNKKLN